MNAELFEKLVTDAGFSAVKRDDGRYKSTPVETLLLPMWQAAYSAGAEQMRERAAQAIASVKLFDTYGNDTGFPARIAERVRNLPVGESSRAPGDKL